VDGKEEELKKEEEWRITKKRIPSFKSRPETLLIIIIDFNLELYILLLINYIYIYIFIYLFMLWQPLGGRTP